MALSLVTLSLDIICEITNYLNARDISSLSSSGDKRLRVMLHEAPGVLRLVQPTLRLRHGLKLPKLALEFRYLRNLTLGTERAYYGGNDKLPDWKVDTLPKSLTSLRVSYPFSLFPFINFPMTELSVPLSNRLASLDWVKAVMSSKLKKFVEGDPNFDPAQLFFNLNLILPQLNTLMVFGEFNVYIQHVSPKRSSSSWVRPFLQRFPSSLHSFGSDWITLDDVVTSIPHSITDLTLRGDDWIPNSLTGLSTLVSRLRSLDVTDTIKLPLSGPDEVSRPFETSFLAANIGLDVLARFKVLETLILKNQLTAEMSLVLPSSLTYLHVNTLTRDVSLEVLPRGLQTFIMDWLNFAFDVRRSQRLPPGLTSLYLPATDRNLADNLVFPQSLVHLALPNLGMRDDQFQLLPKSLRSLKLSRLILTGFLLNPNTECVTVDTIFQSSCNVPKSFNLITQNRSSIEIHYLPPSLTSIDPSLSFAQIPLDSLPPGLNCILRDYPLEPNQLDRLPISLRHLRIDSQMPVKWRYFSQLPRSLTIFRGGIVEFDTVESLEEVISAFGSAARFEIPETFQRHAFSLFGPSASIKPHDWIVRFSPRYFSMLPDTVNTIVARSFDIPQHETLDWHLTSFPKGITSISIADVPQQNNLLQAIPISVKHLYWTQGSLIARPGSLMHLSTLSSLETLSIGCFHINDLLTVTLPKSLTSLSIYQSSMQFDMLKKFPFPPNLTYLALYDRLIAYNKRRPIQREDYLCLNHLPRTLKTLVIRAPIYDCSCVPLLPPSLEYFINGKEEKLASFKRALANQQARTANLGISLLRLQSLDGSVQPLEES